MIYIDLETQSGTKLIGGNLQHYLNDAEFSIICLCFYDSKTKKSPTYQESTLKHFKFYVTQHYAFSSVTFCAHNVSFEYEVLKKYGFWQYLEDFDVEYNFKCTLAKCLAYSISPSLDNASTFLGCKDKKSSEGRALILKYTMPQSNGYLPIIDLITREKFYRYCLQDVKTMIAIDKKLHDPLDNPDNLKNTLLMNTIGLPVDTKLAKKVVNVLETLPKKKEVINVKSPLQVINFCAAHGVTLPNCQQRTLNAFLQKELPPPVRDILIKRQQVKSSLAKYARLLSFSLKDRLKNLFFYYGAHTGRDTARNFQPQNLPRGDELSCQLLSCIDQKDMLDFFSTHAEEVAKKGLRSIIRLPRRKLKSSFFCADLASVELRVLLWLCKDFKKLKKIEQKVDIYKELAAEIFNTHYKSITDEQRYVGKQAVLGLGFGLGAAKFSTLLPDIVNDKEKLAQRIVSVYRDKYALVVNAWHTFMQQFKQINGKFHKWPMETIAYQLPSGRFLIYLHAHYHQGDLNYLSYRPPLMKKAKEVSGVLVNGIQMYRHKLYGGKIVHNITQSIARDILFDACNRLVKQNYRVIARVHDEILAERTTNKQTLADFINIITNVDQKIYPNLPVAAEGWEDDYYHK